MPFKSEKQRKYLFKFKPDIAKEFADKEKSYKNFKMRKSNKGK